MDIAVTDIKAFVTNKPMAKVTFFDNKHHKAVYQERASGDIEVNIKDEKLKKLVESIQKIIKESNDT